ncbi:branched-chain amino acid ABC transporter permease [Nonomuraea sp. NPDC050310]|uniref:branched-chain amino acid ABC transporter permease n=1 Tax=unclassified Nonomuraea TaxID=2593643 RepID=UPI0033F27F43
MLESVVAGLTSGGVYALLGLCVVLTHRLVSVVNFAMAAVGAMGAFVMVTLTDAGLSTWLALPAGVAAGGLLSGLLGAGLVRWFGDHGPAAKAAVTVAVFVGLMAVGLRLFGNLTSGARRFPEAFNAPAFTVGDVVVPQAVLVSLAFAVLITLAVTWLLRRTRVGLRLQAISERPGTAEVVGIPAPRLALAVWVAVGALSSLVIVMVAPRLGGDFSTLANLVTTALAVAMVGAFHSLWLTLAGGVLLGCLEGVAAALEPVQQYRGVLPFLVMVALLWWRSRHDVWEAA